MDGLTTNQFQGGMNAVNWKPNRNSHLSLHVQINDWIKERIRTGEWTIGTKLPSQRKLAELFEVNRSTIIHVLEELTADELIETKPGSGTYVCNNSWNVLLKSKQPHWEKHISESIHEPNYHTIQMINEYEHDSRIIRLGTGELSPALLPVSTIEESLKEIKLHPREIGYSEPKGSLKLRAALSQHLKRRQLQASPENILIVSGALQALQLISLGLLQRGSIVWQKAPSYLNSVHPFQSAGMEVVSYNQDEQLKNMSKLRQSILYTVPTLHNPTGSTQSLEERKQLLSLCKSLQIPIIEDDVYHELNFEDCVPPAIKSLDDTGQVLYVGSVSKTLSPGLRIGWMVGPQPVIDRLADIKMQTDYGSSAISQQLVAHWIETGLYENHLISLRKKLESRASFMHSLLLKHFQGLATWNEPTGGFYIWLKLNHPIVNKQLFLKLLKQQVLINPGYIYQSSDYHHIRLSYVYSDFKQIEEGLLTLKKLITAPSD